MSLLAILLVAALVLGVCFLVDKGFTKLFRSKAQHMSGKAVRANKRYGSFGTILMVLAVMAMLLSPGLLIPGIIVFLMGAAMAGYYLSYGIFYDDDSFLVSSFGRKARTYRFRDIRSQQLYLVTGGNVIVELHMKNGEVVSVQSYMSGAMEFLDDAFSAWCRQTGTDPENSGFHHDPSQSCWFPTEEEL